MIGYEQSPDYGGPQPTWPSMLLILLIATIAGAFFLAFG